MHQWECVTTCVYSTAELINNMVNAAREIKYETALRHLGAELLAEIFPGYTWGKGTRQGLRLKDDYHVSYYRSRFEGKPCLYVEWSGIEHVFTQ